MLKSVITSFNIPKRVRLTVIIDITDYPYYGDRTTGLCVGSKTKKGTSYFNRYFTACIRLEKYYIPLYFHPILQAEGVRPGDLVQRFLKEVYAWCPFSRLLGDAYFGAFPVLKLLKRYHLEFLLNMKHYSPVKEVIKTIRETQQLLACSYGVNIANNRAMYRWSKKKKLLTFRTKIYLRNNTTLQIPLTIQTVLLKRRNNQGERYFKLDYYVYITNIMTSGEHILKTYKSRWGIETEYHIVQIFQGKTTSCLAVLRILLKGLGFILTAL